MPFWYNPPKDGSPFAQLTPIDWDNCNVNDHISFSEMTVTIIPDGFTLAMYVYDAYEVKKAKDRDFKFEPQLCLMTLHDKEFQKKQYKDDKYQTVTVQPSKLEKLLCQIISGAEFALPEGQGLCGDIRFGASDRTIAILSTGLKPDGTTAPGELIKMLTDEVAILKTVELDKLKGVALPSTSGTAKGNWDGSRETEAERLKARLDFALQQLKPFCEGADSVWLAASAINSLENDEQKEAKLALDFLKIIMG